MTQHHPISNDAVEGGGIFSTYFSIKNTPFSPKTWHQMLTLPDTRFHSVRIFETVSILIPDGCGQGVRTGTRKT
ncbi:MAG: hypothetical protein A2V46_15250 [Bacteroidetes bacterium RBG_19FT_COMBO_42_7]|nr:MAG: hypothetical protein A2Y71_11435 [Bacteroidetes bacterium RBG_13_42_15]OFY82299.1 MAG: hypothetical protein A2V46_15250 [Bacteroidetes bacterium RBG_19FT_COMBO_42_7]